MYEIFISKDIKELEEKVNHWFLYNSSEEIKGIIITANDGYIAIIIDHSLTERG